jgi:hypothetical protein
MESKDLIVENFINPRRVIWVMKFLGHTIFTALSEFIDNSIDAKAPHIWINTIRNKNNEIEVIEIIDNGTGMNYDLIEEATKLGSDTSTYNMTSLSRLGMGLKVAAIFLGRKLEILTRKNGEVCLNAGLDFGEISDKGVFTKILRRANPNQSNDFQHTLSLLRNSNSVLNAKKRLREINNTGTIIRLAQLEDIDELKEHDFGTNLAKHLGRIYRKFISVGIIQIYINGKKVDSYDPIYSFDHEILYNEAIKVGTSTIKLKIAEIKYVEGAINLNSDINLANQGFYVLYNNREISAGTTLGIYNKHDDFNTFRSEIYLSGSLHGILKLNMIKNNIQIDRLLRNQLESRCLPFIKSIGSRARLKRTHSIYTNWGYREIERNIAAKSNLLTQPPVYSNADPDNLPNSMSSPRPRKKNTKAEKYQNTKPYLFNFWETSFFEGKEGSDGPLFRAWRIDNRLNIELNTEHQFFVNCIRPIEIDYSYRESILYLLYSMACAELIAKKGNEISNSFYQYNHDIGKNLAVLLG